MANHYDEVPKQQVPNGRCTTCNTLTGGYFNVSVCDKCNGVLPAPSILGADMAFIDSDDVYQECTVRSVLLCVLTRIDRGII